MSLAERRLETGAAAAGDARRTPKRVVPIRAAHSEAARVPSGITQASLRKVMRLRRLEARVSQALRELMLQIDSNLASGGEIEAGELTFNRELKIAQRRNRQRTSTATPIRA